MVNKRDEVELCEVILAVIEKKRFETGDESLGAFVEETVLSHQIRELQNVIERSIVLSQGPVLTLSPGMLPVSVTDKAGIVSTKTVPRDRGPAHSRAEPFPPSAPASLQEIERRHILAVLSQTGGVVEGAKGAARILDLHPNTLRSRMKKLGIAVSAVIK